ncbi:MAG: CheY-specific phosphatase CheX [Planctomycetota bacterium]|jgi:CheY-specific phosphatase CheX
MSSEDQVGSDTPRGLNVTDEELLTILREGAEEVFMMLGEMGELVDSDKAPSANGCSETAALADIAYEIIVEFTGPLDGVVIMRCQDACATSITRGMLMMEESEALAQEDILDALGECTNRLGGFFKRQALDPSGTFKLGIPRIEQHVIDVTFSEQGHLVYELSDSQASIEVWLGK